jgi:hypothetical protein
LSSTQVAALSPAQVSKLIPAQVSQLGAEQAVGLSAAQISKLSISDLSNDAIPVLSNNVLKSVKLSSLSIPQVSSLTDKQIAGFTANQLSLLNPEGLSVEQFQAISPNNFKLLYSKTPTILEKIFSLSPVLSALDSSKLGVFPKSFFNSFDANPDQLVLLSSDARSWISAQGYHMKVNEAGKEIGISTDTIKPVFMQAFVSEGKDIKMSFNELLNERADQQALKTSFKVINTTDKAIKYSIDVITTSGSEVTIKLLRDGEPVSIIDPTHNLRLSYTDPSKADDWNALQDSSGNDLISLTGINVLNGGFG